MFCSWLKPFTQIKHFQVPCHCSNLIQLIFDFGTRWFPCSCHGRQWYSQPCRDRTATGATPPRSPTRVKTVPPGLPEEEAQESAMALAGSFGADFLKELFREARQGDAARMSVQLQKVHSAAFSLLSGSGIGFADGGHHTVAEQSEGAAELTADFLDKVRNVSDTGTLLGAATAGGISVLHMLLHHKANPVQCFSFWSCTLRKPSVNHAVAMIAADSYILGRQVLLRRSGCKQRRWQHHRLRLLWSFFGTKRLGSDSNMRKLTVSLASAVNLGAIVTIVTHTSFNDMKVLQERWKTNLIM